MKKTTIQLSFTKKEIDFLPTCVCSSFLRERKDRFRSFTNGMSNAIKKDSDKCTFYFFDDFISAKIFEAYQADQDLETALLFDKNDDEYVVWVKNKEGKTK
jgi:hypothetical protein